MLRYFWKGVNKQASFKGTAKLTFINVPYKKAMQVSRGKSYI